MCTNQDGSTRRKRDFRLNILPVERELDEVNIFLDTFSACQDGEARCVETWVEYHAKLLGQFQITVEPGVDDRPVHLACDGQQQNGLSIRIYMTNQERCPRFIM
jgi:hypothetical protein